MEHGPLTYAHLRNLHPDYDAAYWRECRALLAGGRRLLRDPETLRALFPQHPHEEDAVYAERCRRAFSIPYAGEIIGDLVGTLVQDPVRVTSEPAPDKFYADTFVENVDRRGLTLTAYVQAMVREALTTQRAWALVDLPPRPQGDPEAEPSSLRDEEAAGLLRAWVTPLEAEVVTDWEVDEDDELLWACIRHCSRRRPTPGADRATMTEVFTFYDRESWARYEVSHEDGKPPKDETAVTPKDQGFHTFGRVPLVRLELDEALWAMDKLHGLARAHFQQRSALSYSQNKGLFPILAAFLGPELGSGGVIPSDAQQSPGRATEQKYGVGRVTVFGHQDALRYVSPDPGVYTFAGADLSTLRDEMHRVCSMMAAALDNTPSSVGRSGESKKQDKSAKELVLQHLGVLACDHVADVLRMVAAGRKDPAVTWFVAGLRYFDQVSARDAVETAQLVEGLTIPSPTFWRVHRTATAKRLVAHDATTAELEAIGDEIRTNTPDEDYGGGPGPAPRTLPEGEAPEDPEEAGEEDPKGEERPSKPPPSPARGSTGPGRGSRGRAGGSEG